MTQSQDDATFLDSGFLAFQQRVEMEAILLDFCKVERGDGNFNNPGAVETDIGVQYSIHDKCVFLVNASANFHDEEGENIASIEVGFAVVLNRNEPYDPSDQEVAGYVNSLLIVQVAPFIREFFATMTNRLGIPTFFMPIYRLDGDEITTIERIYSHADDGPQ